jgi:hypothetical protein
MGLRQRNPSGDLGVTHARVWERLHGRFLGREKERHVRDAVQYRNPSLQFRASHDHGRSLFALYGFLTTERIQECVSNYTMYLLHTLRYPIPIARSNAMLMVQISHKEKTVEKM